MQILLADPNPTVEKVGADEEATRSPTEST